MQAVANQGMPHGSSMGSKHPGPLLNGISEEGQDTSTYQSELFVWSPWPERGLHAVNWDEMGAVVMLLALSACMARKY